MKEKQSIAYVVVLLMLGPLVLFAAEFMAAWDLNTLKTLHPNVFVLLQKAMPHLLKAKLLYLLLLLCTLFLFDVYKYEQNRWGIFIDFALALGGLFYFFSFPKLVITGGDLPLLAIGYPVAFVVFHFGIVRIYRTFGAVGTKAETSVFGINKTPLDQYSITLKTTKGDLVVPNLFRGNWVVGGAGAGKSASLIEPIIFRCMMKGFTGIIYDFKGNPPTLTTTALRCIEYLKNNTPSDYPGKIPSFHQINFSQPWLSDRINILSPKYVTSSLVAKSMATTLAFAMEKMWVKQADFWAKNAISILHATIWHLAKNYPGYCTLPHAIALITSDAERLMDFLNEDEEVKTLMRPVSDAHQMGAEGQVAGALSSIQLPMNSLLNPEIFWAFSEDEIDISINDPETPAWLCICNDPIKKEGLDPGISLLLSFLAVWLNQQGKRPCLYAIDELPTAYIANIEQLPATGRSNKIAVLAGAQSYAQLEARYDQHNAATLKATLGNSFTGNVSLEKEASELVKSLGQFSKRKTEFSYSESGTSRSERTENKDNLKANQIMDLKPGEFVGHLAGAEKGWFHLQFKQLKDYVQLPEVEFPRTYPDKDILKALIEANYSGIKAEANSLLEEALMRKLAANAI